MKKQILTKRYNTDCARLIGYGIYEKNIAHLHMKRNGECFLVSDNQIYPLDERSALNFAIEYNLIMEFTEALEYCKNPKRQISAYLTEIGRSRLEKISKLWNLSISETIERMINYTEDALKEKKAENEKALNELLKKYDEETRAEN